MRQKKAPASVKRNVKMTLIGWSGDMIGMIPENLRAGAEIANQSRDPNSFVAPVDMDESKRKSTLSGSFDFPHYTNDDPNERYHYDKLQFFFKPLFIHTKR